MLYKSHFQEDSEASWGSQQPKPIGGTKTRLKGAEGSGARKGTVSGAGCPECLSLSAPLIPADRARQESSGITYWLGLPVQVLYMLRFQLPTFGIGTPSSFSVLELSLIKLAAFAGSTSDPGT